MIITILLSVGALMSVYVAYKQAQRATEFETELIEKTSINEALKKHCETLEASTKYFTQVSAESAEHIKRLNSQIQSLTDKAKQKSKPVNEKKAPAAKAADSNSSKKRTYNKRKA
jgi:hypothetical protein